MRYARIISCLSAAAVLGVTACSSDATSGKTGGSAAGGSGGTTNVTLLSDITFSGAHAFMFAGKEQGFFKKHGINLNIVVGTGSADSAAKVGSKTADFAVVDSSAALNTINKGAHLMLITAVEQSNPGGLCSIDSRHPIHSFADANNLSIGASTGDANMLPLPYLMQQNNVTPHYKSVAVTNESRIPLLLSNKVDAVACGHHGMPSYVASAQKAGLKLDSFLYADHGFDALGWSLITRSDLVNSKSKLVQNFVDAFVESLDFSVANPTKAVADFVKANPEQTTAKATPEWQGEIPLLKNPSGKDYVYDEGRINATVDFANAAYKGALKPADVYTNKFVEEATSK